MGLLIGHIHYQHNQVGAQMHHAAGMTNIVLCDAPSKLQLCPAGGHG